MTKIEALAKARRVREQKKAVEMLYELDHAFISREGVEKLTKPFGFMGTTYIAKADPPGTFKGLSLYDKNGNSIPEMEGQDATVTAEQICKHLNLDYIPQHGRGSQLRVCAARIMEHISEKAPDSVGLTKIDKNRMSWSL